jgi:hypothetical protein
MSAAVGMHQSSTGRLPKIVLQPMVTTGPCFSNIGLAATV